MIIDFSIDLNIELSSMGKSYEKSIINYIKSFEIGVAQSSAESRHFYKKLGQQKQKNIYPCIILTEAQKVKDCCIILLGYEPVSFSTHQ